MKMFFTLFAVVLLPIYACALSSIGDTCFDDSTCEFFCSDSQCQSALPLWATCSGNSVHPRECGSSRYCDPTLAYTCQFQKNTGDTCTYSYSCLTGICDYGSSTCKSSNSNSFNWLLPILIPSIIVFIILIALISAIIASTRRRQALASYQNPYVVLPSAHPYHSYQNPCIVEEAPPPPYRVAIHTPAPKLYQS